MKPGTQFKKLQKYREKDVFITVLSGGRGGRSQQDAVGIACRECYQHHFEHPGAVHDLCQILHRLFSSALCPRHDETVLTRRRRSSGRATRWRPHGIPPHPQQSVSPFWQGIGLLPPCGPSLAGRAGRLPWQVDAEQPAGRSRLPGTSSGSGLGSPQRVIGRLDGRGNLT